jgi:O-antigen/teichoic acid export membrane protein
VTQQNLRLAVTIGKNTFFGILASVAQVGTRLVTVPIVIGYLGLAGYGIWNIIMTAAAYMRFGSIGIKSAFQKYVAEATGSGDYEKASHLLSTGCAAMLVLSVLGLLPVCFFSLPIARAAGVPQEFLRSASGAIAVLAVIMVIANVGAAFEAIVMGGHRIDLARRFTTLFTVAEAVAIIIALRLGYGLFTMATIMGTSEVGFIVCCYFASRRVLPKIFIRAKFLSKSVLYELFRFAGSYQLVNILEVLYNAILPFALLRAFGAESAGVYAVVTRVVTSALIIQDSFLLPILSGGTMVFASGSSDLMRTLLAKAFKVTFILSLLPLGFISVFGGIMVYAWTGLSGPAFRISLYLLSLTGLFRSFSLLGLVLYRVSGRAVLDNVRQVLRILIILLVAAFARSLGFYGVLAGLGGAELFGMVFMMLALSDTFQGFDPKSLLPDFAKLLLAAGLILAAGAMASYIPIPSALTGRVSATLRLGAVSLACMLTALPALRLTKSITATEARALIGVFLPNRTGSPKTTLTPASESQ